MLQIVALLLAFAFSSVIPNQVESVEADPPEALTSTPVLLWRQATGKLCF